VYMRAMVGACSEMPETDWTLYYKTTNKFYGTRYYYHYHYHYHYCDSFAFNP